MPAGMMSLFTRMMGVAARANNRHSLAQRVSATRVTLLLNLSDFDDDGTTLLVVYVDIAYIEAASGNRGIEKRIFCF